jgi:hypothetical protein
MAFTNLTLKTQSGRIIATKVKVNPNLKHRRFLRKALHVKLARAKQRLKNKYLERLEMEAEEGSKAIEENIKLKTRLEKIKAEVGKM